MADRERTAELVEPLAAAPWRLNLEANAGLWTECKRDLDEAHLASQCASLSVPVLVLHGAEDPRPAWATDSLVAALPDAQRVVVAGAGHLPFVERPAAFRDVVEPFLREVGAGG
ncbi:MAG TPA: alpha/beta hydrolase [Acidimicrobiales bacterium]|nr:alpha/beta hydrolase [Acidimicrobiales bacterium]